MATLHITEGNPYDNQTKNQRDVTTQSIISIALGLGAFLAFCVSDMSNRNLIFEEAYHTTIIDFETKMDGTLRSAKTAEKCCFNTARAAEDIFWLDTCVV